MSKPMPFEELKTLTGYSKAADIVAFLKRENIPYWTGKYGRPITTTGLMEQAATQVAGKSSPATSAPNQLQNIDV